VKLIPKGRVKKLNGPGQDPQMGSWNKTWDLEGKIGPKGPNKT